ncbi:MAG TPA: FecR domain-containing protein [Opitutus sp.]|nr:FecR domain-containing protein [Opitutus sp.]
MPLPNDDFLSLCVRVLSGEAAPAEQRRFARLLGDAEHRASYERLRAAWQATGQAPPPRFNTADAWARLQSRLAPAGRLVPPPRAAAIRATRPRIRPLLPWLAVAAAVAIAAGTAFWSRRSPAVAPRPAWTEYTAPPGERTVVRLADGTRITLDGRSTISYPASFAGDRTVRLIGEAFFEVAHDPARPFTVFAGGLKTIVRGTRFDVRALPGDRRTTVALVEGRVEVAALHPAPPADPVVLRPGQQFSLVRATGSERVAAFDADLAMDWMHGALVFRDESLASVAARLAHRFGASIEIADPGLAEKTIDARFGRESLSEILQAISFASGIRYDVQPGAASVTRVRLSAGTPPHPAP